MFSMSDRPMEANRTRWNGLDLDLDLGRVENWPKKLLLQSTMCDVYWNGGPMDSSYTTQLVRPSMRGGVLMRKRPWMRQQQQMQQQQPRPWPTCRMDSTRPHLAMQDSNPDSAWIRSAGIEGWRCWSLEKDWRSATVDCRRTIWPLGVNAWKLPLIYASGAAAAAVAAAAAGAVAPAEDAENAEAADVVKEYRDVGDARLWMPEKSTMLLPLLLRCFVETTRAVDGGEIPWINKGSTWTTAIGKATNLEKKLVSWGHRCSIEKAEVWIRAEIPVSPSHSVSPHYSRMDPILFSSWRHCPDRSCRFRTRPRVSMTRSESLCWRVRRMTPCAEPFCPRQTSFHRRRKRTNESYHRRNIFYFPDVLWIRKHVRELIYWSVYPRFQQLFRQRLAAWKPDKSLLHYPPFQQAPKLGMRCRPSAQICCWSHFSTLKKKLGHNKIAIGVLLCIQTSIQIWNRIDNIIRFA